MPSPSLNVYSLIFDEKVIHTLWMSLLKKCAIQITKTATGCEACGLRPYNSIWQSLLSLLNQFLLGRTFQNPWNFPLMGCPPVFSSNWASRRAKMAVNYPRLLLHLQRTVYGDTDGQFNFNQAVKRYVEFQMITCKLTTQCYKLVSNWAIHG